MVLLEVFVADFNSIPAVFVLAEHLLNDATAARFVLGFAPHK